MKRKTLVVGAVITVVAPFLQALAQEDLSQVVDYRAWLVGLGLASVRHLAVYLLAHLPSAE